MHQVTSRHQADGFAVHLALWRRRNIWQHLGACLGHGLFVGNGWSWMSGGSACTGGEVDACMGGGGGRRQNV
jgi:hypothetical protein